MGSGQNQTGTHGSATRERSNGLRDVGAEGAQDFRHTSSARVTFYMIGFCWRVESCRHGGFSCGLALSQQAETLRMSGVCICIVFVSSRQTLGAVEWLAAKPGQWVEGCAGLEVCSHRWRGMKLQTRLRPVLFP